MFEYVSLDKALIEQAAAQIRQWHTDTTQAESLVWAIAHEQIASEIRDRVAADQITKSGLSLPL